jgi:hypothetical protein
MSFLARTRFSPSSCAEFIVCAFCIIGSAPASAQARECSLADVAGQYGVTLSGTIAAVGPVAIVGQFTLDASGRVTGAETASFNGNVVKETVSGTATVNPDCTGTATIDVFRSGVLVRTTSLDIVVDDNQTEIRAIALTNGTTVTVIARRTFTKDDHG